jgi:putative transcriptional regulator
VRGFTKIFVDDAERLAFQQNFGENLQALRKAKGINQKELGELLGLSNETVSSLERGRIFISSETVIKLAKFFAIPVYELFLFPDNRDIIPNYVALMRLIKDQPADIQTALEKQIRLTLTLLKEATMSDEERNMPTSYRLR